MNKGKADIKEPCYSDDIHKYEKGNDEHMIFVVRSIFVVFIIFV